MGGRKVAIRIAVVLLVVPLLLACPKEQLIQTLDQLLEKVEMLCKEGGVLDRPVIIEGKEFDPKAVCDIATALKDYIGDPMSRETPPELEVTDSAYVVKR